MPEKISGDAKKSFSANKQIMGNPVLIYATITPNAGNILFFFNNHFIG